MMIARTAAQYGALCANSARVVGFLREDDRVVGARVRDLESGHEFDVRATEVINAAGVWIDEIQKMVGGRGQFQVRASKGVHLVVPRNRINSATGIITRTEKSLLFIIPWGSHWIIGTTDTDWKLDLAHPAASSTDIDYLLDHANSLLQDPLTREDVVGVYAGLRPLLSGESDSTSQLSREHAVSSPVRGLTVIAGGKYTTYRVMAKDAVDAAVHGMQRKVPRSCTERDPAGSAPTATWAPWNSRQLTAARTGLRVRQVEHLLGRYGTLMSELLDLIAERPELGEPLAGAPEYLKVEAVYAASHEGALHLEDVLTRRTRISIETWRPRPRRRPGGGRPGRAGARLGRARHRPRGRALPRSGRGRAGVPAPARRPDRRRRAPGRPGRAGGGERPRLSRMGVAACDVPVPVG